VATGKNGDPVKKKKGVNEPPIHRSFFPIKTKSTAEKMFAGNLKLLKKHKLHTIRIQPRREKTEEEEAFYIEYNNDRLLQLPRKKR